MCPGDDLLRIEEIVLVRQSCSATTVAFLDDSVADYFDAQVDRGLRPEQFGRIWLHTHPGDSPLPSDTDEETFARVFGGAQWAVMFILAETGASYTRLRFNVGPGGSLEIPIEVDYQLPFAGSHEAVWEQEYLANVTVLDPLLPGGVRTARYSVLGPTGPDPAGFDEDLALPLWPRRGHWEHEEHDDGVYRESLEVARHDW